MNCSEFHLSVYIWDRLFQLFSGVKEELILWHQSLISVVGKLASVGPVILTDPLMSQQQFKSYKSHLFLKMLFQFIEVEENFVFFLIMMETLFILFVFILFVATLVTDPKHRSAVISYKTILEAAS